MSTQRNNQIRALMEGFVVTHREAIDKALSVPEPVKGIAPTHLKIVSMARQELGLSDKSNSLGIWASIVRYRTQLKVK